MYFIVCLGWVLVKFTACVAFFEAFGLVVFVALGVFVAFMGHWSWTFVAFFFFYSVYGALVFGRL